MTGEILDKFSQLVTTAWCTERRGRVIDFWIAFSEVVIVVRGLI